MSYIDIFKNGEDFLAFPKILTLFSKIHNEKGCTNAGDLERIHIHWFVCTLFLNNIAAELIK